jgi:hypothetical protein
MEKRMKVVLTTHSVLSCAGDEKECHILKKILRKAAASRVIYDPARFSPSD